jgi:hypothetical protein
LTPVFRHSAGTAPNDAEPCADAPQRLNAVAVAVLMAFVLLLPTAVRAADAKPGELLVLGVPVEPVEGVYLVLKDVNVRAEPETNSKRVNKLEAGTKVKAVGRVKGPWLAVRRDGKVLGFVYEPILMPMIDGTLAEPVGGTVAVHGVGQCVYAIEFVGKSEAGDQRFEFADYGVDWRCRPSGDTKKDLIFHTPMFLSEGPYQGTRKAVHQITVDVLELAGSLEEVFSTHLLWDRNKGEVMFDSTTIKKFAHAKPPDAQKAEVLSDALKSAVETAAHVWTESVWTALAKKH